MRVKLGRAWNAVNAVQEGRSTENGTVASGDKQSLWLREYERPKPKTVLLATLNCVVLFRFSRVRYCARVPSIRS